MAFFNQNKANKKVPIHKFLAKMKEFSEGKITFEQLCAWIDSKPNKDELYQYLRIGAQTMINHLEQIDDPAEQEKFIPFLEWFLGTTPGNPTQTTAHTVNSNEAPAANPAAATEN